MALADNVKMFPGITPNDYDANFVLELSARQPLKTAIVIGEYENGDFFFTSSIAGGPECLWLLEMAKLKLMKAVE